MRASLVTPFRGIEATSWEGEKVTFKRATITLFCIAAMSFVAGSALAQNWPLPSKMPDTDVICTGCPDNAANNPTTGYPATAFKTFTGRFLDSSTTEDIQQYFRTGRAYKSFYNPAVNRIYMIVGSAIFAYDANRFFTRLEGSEALMPSTA